MSSKKEQTAIKRISMAEKRVDRQLESLRKQEERLLKLKERIQLGKDKLQMIRNKLTETKEKYEPFIVSVKPEIIEQEPEIIEPEETVEQIISEYVDYIISNPIETESTQSSEQKDLPVIAWEDLPENFVEYIPEIFVEYVPIFIQEEPLEIKTSSITIYDDQIITLEHNQEYEEEIKTISIYEDLDIKENIKIIPEEIKEKTEKKPKKVMGIDLSEYITAEPETITIDTMQPKTEKKQKKSKPKEEFPESNVRITRKEKKQPAQIRNLSPEKTLEKREISPIKVIQTNQTGTQNILKASKHQDPVIAEQIDTFNQKYGSAIDKKVNELFEQYRNKKLQQTVGIIMNKKQKEKFDTGLEEQRKYIYNKVKDNVFNNCPEGKREYQEQESIKNENNIQLERVQAVLPQLEKSQEEISEPVQYVQRFTKTKNSVAYDSGRWSRVLTQQETEKFNEIINQQNEDIKIERVDTSYYFNKRYGYVNREKITITSSERIFEWQEQQFNLKLMKNNNLIQ